MVRVEAYSWDGAESRDEFENILSVLDFPMESLEGDELVGDWDISKSQFLGPIPFDELMGPLSIAHNKTDFAPIDATPETKHILQEQGVVHTQSPVSVLESSSSKNSTTKSHTGKRPRSKRSRPSGPSPWLSMSLLFPTSSKTNKISKKSKERRSPFSLSNVEVPGDGNHHPVATKKCTHCEVTKTPQWREGPLGPKTLCNACGVRYRSGRLYPEYRPAASPTFVPSLHSNSHKKVIEMRTKGKEMYPELEFVPLNSYLFEN